ncbi:hypothetical protein ACTOJ1_001024 [Shigella flexneri]
MKRLMTVFTLMLVIFSFNATAETVSGQIQVSLTILPSEGCSQQYCAIKPDKIIKDLKNNSNKENYKISKSDSVVTVEF